MATGDKLVTSDGLKTVYDVIDGFLFGDQGTPRIKRQYIINSSNVWKSVDSHHLIFPCKPGDEIKLVANQSTTAIYAFLADSTAVNNQTPAFAENETGRRTITKGTSSGPITAPSGTKWLYVAYDGNNGATNYYPSSLTINSVSMDLHVSKDIGDLRDSVDVLDDRVDDLETSVGGFENAVDGINDDLDRVRTVVPIWQTANKSSNIFTVIQDADETGWFSTDNGKLSVANTYTVITKVFDKDTTLYIERNNVNKAIGAIIYSEALDSFPKAASDYYVRGGSTYSETLPLPTAQSPWNVKAGQMLAICLQDVTSSSLDFTMTYSNSDYISLADGVKFATSQEQDIGTIVHGITNDIEDDITTIKRTALITNTASGNIATFNNDTDGTLMQSVIADIDAVQDLHGYDRPWPAGGGKNLIPDTPVSASTNGCTSVFTNGTMTITETATSSGGGTVLKTGDFHLDAGSYYFKKFNASGSPAPTSYIQIGNSTITSSEGLFTLEEAQDNINIGFNVSSGNTYNYSVKLLISKTDDAAWSPYSNICPITGQTGASVMRTGKNLVDISGFTLEKTGTTSKRVALPQQIPAGNYVLSLNVTANSTTTTSIIRVYNVASGGPVEQRAILNDTIAAGATGQKSFAFTADESFGIIYMSIKSTDANSAAITFDDIQLELGSTATAYEPYQGTTITTNWQTEAGTVYGGTLDVTNGTLTVNRAIVDLGTLDWNYITSGKSPYFSSRAALSPEYLYKVQNPNVLCSNYSYNGIGSTGSDIGFTIINTSYVRVRDLNYTDAVVFKTAMSGVQLIYELATPVTYTLTPQQITTLLGYNAIWANTGAINITYPISTSNLINTIQELTYKMTDYEIRNGLYHEQSNGIFSIGNAYRCTWPIRLPDNLSENKISIRAYSGSDGVYRIAFFDASFTVIGGDNRIQRETYDTITIPENSVYFALGCNADKTNTCEAKIMVNTIQSSGHGTVVEQTFQHMSYQPHFVWNDGVAISASNGELVIAQDYSATDMIRIPSNLQVSNIDYLGKVSSSSYNTIEFYTASKQYISGVRHSKELIFARTAIPLNAVYFRLCSLTANKNAANVIAYIHAFDNTTAVAYRAERVAELAQEISNSNETAISEINTEIKHKTDILTQHQYDFLSCENFVGFYKSDGSLDSSENYRSYLIPIITKDKYFFCNRELTVAILDANKTFIVSSPSPTVPRVAITNEITGTNTSITAYRYDISAVTNAAYISVPRKGSNLTFIRSSSNPDIIPIFPFNSDSTCEQYSITCIGDTIVKPAREAMRNIIENKSIDMTTGQMGTVNGTGSTYCVISEGTEIHTECTAASVVLKGQTVDGPLVVSIGAGGAYTFTKDFWGMVEYTMSGTWAWSDFIPPNLGVKESAIFVRIVTPEEKVNNPWRGKHWYCYGTSISDIGTGDTSGNNGHSGKYPLYFDAVSGIIRHNGAYGSKGIRTKDGTPGQVLTNLLSTPYDVDLVTLETLPNDDVTTDSAVGEITDTDATTICGAFKTACEYIQNNTRAKFVLIFITGYAADTDAMSPTHMAYIAAKDKLKKIAEAYGVPVIDAEKDCADWAHRKEGILLKDWIHPNYLGGEIIGRYLLKELIKIQPNPIYPAPSA